MLLLCVCELCVAHSRALAPMMPLSLVARAPCRAGAPRPDPGATSWRARALPKPCKGMMVVQLACTSTLCREDVNACASCSSLLPSHIHPTPLREGGRPRGAGRRVLRGGDGQGQRGLGVAGGGVPGAGGVRAPCCATSSCWLEGGPLLEEGLWVLIEGKSGGVHASALPALMPPLARAPALKAAATLLPAQQPPPFPPLPPPRRSWSLGAPRTSPSARPPWWWWRTRCGGGFWGGGRWKSYKGVIRKGRNQEDLGCV